MLIPVQHKLYWSGSRTLIIVRITAQLPWFSLLLGLPSDYGCSEELDCCEASGQQLGVQQGGTWLDGRHTVLCLWSVIGVKRRLLPSERHRQYHSLRCRRQTSPFVVQTANNLGTGPAVLPSCDKSGDALLRWQARFVSSWCDKTNYSFLDVSNAGYLALSCSDRRVNENAVLIALLFSLMNSH